MPAVPSARSDPAADVSPASTGTHGEPDVITLPDARPAHLTVVPASIDLTTIDLTTIDLTTVDTSAVAAVTTPEIADAPRVVVVPAPEPHAPPIVTRLVLIGLIGIAAAIVVSALAHNRAASTSASQAFAHPSTAVAPVSLPTVAHVISATRSGDVVSLTVDPAGNPGRTTLLLDPDATVLLSHPIGALPAGTLLPLQTFLDAVSNNAAALRAATFHLRYDSSGEVSALTQA